MDDWSIQTNIGTKVTFVLALPFLPDFIIINIGMHHYEKNGKAVFQKYALMTLI